jgi:hypothetical protein
LAHYANLSSDSRLILRDSAQKLSCTFYSGETAIDADGSVTIGIVDSAGTTVVASGTATTSGGTGIYEYSLAGQSNLKELTATWSGTWGSAMEFKTTSQVVGGFYTTPAEIRGLDSISGETGTFPAADVVDAIIYAEQIIDDYVGAPFVQRYQMDTMNGTDDQVIKGTKMFPTTLLAASIDGTALSATEISNTALFQDGTMKRKDAVWAYTEAGNNVVLEYEYGSSTYAPNDIRWCARTLARYHLLEQVSNLPTNAISIQSELGQIQLSQPSMSRPTPLPDVNVILNRHRHRAPTVF